MHFAVRISVSFHLKLTQPCKSIYFKKIKIKKKKDDAQQAWRHKQNLAALQNKYEVLTYLTHLFRGLNDPADDVLP